MIAAAAQCSEMISPLQRAGRAFGVQSSTASLEITSSTSRETSGKPEFMPKSSRLMLVFADEGEPRRAAGRFALHRDVDAERPRHAEQRQVAGHADRVVVDLLQPNSRRNRSRENAPHRGTPPSASNRRTAASRRPPTATGRGKSRCSGPDGRDRPRCARETGRNCPRVRG